MTIAACLVTSGGVVLGADSTQTVETSVFAVPHYFNHAQKLFEVGEDASLGVVTWGLGLFDGISYRRFFAELGDWVEAKSPTLVSEVAQQLVSSFWAAYGSQASSIHPLRQRCVQLASSASLSANEKVELYRLRQNLAVGFCLGGWVGTDRTPTAYAVLFEPELASPPCPTQMSIGYPYFWGVSNIMARVINGIDQQLAIDIMSSDHWSGTEADLSGLITPHRLRPTLNLPIREAIDYVHSAIEMTCKGLKFSHFEPVCGGPIEIAVVTADRRFRWVTHKTMNEAIG